MGQQNTHLQEYVDPLLAKLSSDEPLMTTLISDEINTLTSDKFLTILTELNKLSKDHFDADGNQYVFAVKKGTDSSIFWKSSIQIAYVKIDPKTRKVISYRLLCLRDFLKVFNTLKCQSSAAEQCTTNTSSISGNTSEKTNQKECCCICFERKQEVTLPCAHSFCLQCVEEWNEEHNTCPICRGTLESTDDTWIMSEVPNADEISHEIQANLNELIEDRSPTCAPS